MITQEQIVKFKEKISKWRAAPASRNDKEFVACYTKDRKQLRVVLRLVEQGRYQEAGRKAWDLDTIVRDQIPQSVYNVIMEAYNE